jgi:hypothetical protein
LPSHCKGPFNKHLHQTVQSLSLHHGEQPALVLSPCSLFSERHSPGGTGGGGGSGGGGGGAGRQKAHEEHLHQVQCTAACLGWHMAVHRRLGVSPVWAEGQVAGRSYPIFATKARGAAGASSARELYPGGYGSLQSYEKFSVYGSLTSPLTSPSSSTPTQTWFSPICLREANT